MKLEVNLLLLVFCVINTWIGVKVDIKSSLVDWVSLVTHSNQPPSRSGTQNVIVYTSIGKLEKRVRAAQSVEANKLSPNVFCAATRGKMQGSISAS